MNTKDKKPAGALQQVEETRYAQPGATRNALLWFGMLGQYYDGPYYNQTFSSYHPWTNGGASRDITVTVSALYTC